MNTMSSLTHGSVCTRCLLSHTRIRLVCFLPASASLSFLDTWFLAHIRNGLRGEPPKPLLTNRSPEVQKILVIHGSTGTPKGPPWCPGLDFHRVLMDFGTPLGADFMRFVSFFFSRFVVTLLQCRVLIFFFHGFG